MSTNLKLPTSNSRNWGSGLNAYIESLSSRMAVIENNFLTQAKTGARVMQNVGASSSGLVGTNTVIEHITTDGADIIEVSALSVYIGGEILTYYDRPKSKYALIYKTHSGYDVHDLSWHGEWTPNNNMAYYIYLQYDIKLNDFILGFDYTYHGFNYSQILIGVYFRGKFSPFYTSNLKSIPQHINEYQQARIDLDEHNIGMDITLYSDALPVVTLLRAEHEIKDSATETTMTKIENPGIGPVFYLNGLGYAECKAYESISKWYSGYDALDKKTIPVVTDEMQYLYLADSVENVTIKNAVGATVETIYNRIKTTIVDKNNENDVKEYVPYTESSSPDTYVPRGHYYRVLLSVIDQLLIIQKSSDTTFMNNAHYDVREQNLYNVKFNNVFLHRLDESKDAEDAEDNLKNYDFALDALFCVEIGRFCVNDLGNDSYFKYYESVGVPKTAPEGLVYQTHSITYPNNAIKYTYHVKYMKAVNGNDGLYGTESYPGIKAAQEGELCYVEENNTLWKCSETFNQVLEDKNFFNYWTYLRPDVGAATLSHNFAFVPATNYGMGSQMKWNIWQTKQGLINFDYIDIGSSPDQCTSNLKLDITRENYILHIKYDNLLPFTAKATAKDPQFNRFLFEKYAAENFMFLSSVKGLQIHNAAVHDNAGDDAPNYYSTWRTEASPDTGILIYNHIASSHLKAKSDGPLTIDANQNLYLNSGILLLAQANQEQHDINQNGLYRYGKQKDSDEWALEIAMNGASTAKATHKLNIISGWITTNQSILIEGDNSLTVTSDRRVKNNINDYHINALDIINQVPIKTFNYNSSDQLSIGLIAQELENVVENSDLFIDQKTVDQIDDCRILKETKLIYILWKAVQELSSKIK